MDSQPLVTDQKVLQEQQAQTHHSTEWSGAGEKLEKITASFAAERAISGYAPALAVAAWQKASRSALILSAFVVGIPCGKPG